MARLSNATLAGLPASVARPAYDRGRLMPGIVHLGIGAFHRAHQAVAIDDVLAAAPDWGIVGASLRGTDIRDALRPQDGLYTLAVRSGEGERLRIIGGVMDVVAAREERDLLLALMTSPRVKIVSLTVTEKGYCHDPATGELDPAHPDIVHDLANPHAPRSAPGLIVEALARRRAAGIAPFTVLTCDNLPSNGAVVARIVARLAALRDADLGAWVAGEVAFPSTMVDRITPATSDADRAAIAVALGVEDAAPVITEPFSQWVVEDHFPAGRPPLEDAGIEFVADVEPFERMKLRLLNGAHSSLAYLGYLAGHETVADTMADPAFARFVEGVMGEAAPTLRMPAGTDVAAYRAALLARFRNPALRHRTWQIAMDGSQKLPQRLLGTIRDRIATGAPIPHLALGVAGWMRYVAGIDEAGAAIDVRDPLAATLRAASDKAGRDASALVQALAGVEAIFGRDLATNPRFTGPVTDALSGLLGDGSRKTVGRPIEGGSR